MQVCLITEIVSFGEMWVCMSHLDTFCSYMGGTFAAACVCCLMFKKSKANLKWKEQFKKKKKKTAAHSASQIWMWLTSNRSYLYYELHCISSLVQVLIERMLPVSAFCTLIFYCESFPAMCLALQARCWQQRAPKSCQSHWSTGALLNKSWWR